MSSITAIPGISKALLCLVIALTFSIFVSSAYATSAEDAILKGNWNMVIKILESDGTSTNPSVARFLMGHACLAGKQYNKAKSWFDSVMDKDDYLLWSEWNKSLLKKHPYNPIAIYLSADAMLRINNIDKAIEGYELALIKQEDFELASEALRRINGHNDRYNQTISGNDITRNHNFHEAEPYSKESNNYNKNDGNGRANSVHTKSIKTNSNHIDSNFILGKKHYQKGEYRQAIKYFTKTLESDNQNYQAYRNRGDSYHNQGEYDKAIADYTKAVEINPEHPEAYNDRGVVYYDIGQIDNAISDFTRAIEINSNYANSYTNRGIIYIEVLGDVEMGCADWKRACELGQCSHYSNAKMLGTCD